MSTRSSPTVAAAGTGGTGTSTITAEMVTGWHVLRINGYSGTKGLGIGKSIKSAPFNVGGHMWCIRYYPDGYCEENGDCICVDLCLESPGAEARALCKYSLLDQAGEPVTSYTKTSSSIRTFSINKSSWDFYQFIRREVLESSSHLKDDSFRIRCDVTVVTEISTDTNTMEPVVMVPPPNLHGHFGALLASGVGGDLTLDVGGEQFTVHKCVLAARSAVFTAELFGPMKEGTAAHLRIQDMEARVFRILLHFIYTDTLPEIEEGEKNTMAQHLLVAADRYDLQRLKSICEEMLLKYINTSTAATTLALAEQHGCHGLKEGCFKFLMSPGNLKAVMATDGFKHLMSSCPSIVEKLLAKFAS